jgi:MFS family permease
MLMIVLDATIVNVALPTIQDDLGFAQNDLAWVVNAYLIAFGGLLLLAGRIGDLIGQRRIFLIGLAVFTAASLRPGSRARSALRCSQRSRPNAPTDCWPTASRPPRPSTPAISSRM